MSAREANHVEQQYNPCCPCPCTANLGQRHGQRLKCIAHSTHSQSARRRPPQHRSLGVLLVIGPPTTTRHGRVTRRCSSSSSSSSSYRQRNIALIISTLHTVSHARVYKLYFAECLLRSTTFEAASRVGCGLLDDCRSFECSGRYS